MKEQGIIFWVVAIVLISGFVALVLSKFDFGKGYFQQQAGLPCRISAGEWQPQRGECPGNTLEIQAKCEEFCKKHSDCCPGWRENDKGGFGGKGEWGGRQELFPLPSESEISSLNRNYPAIIKALNEVQEIYPDGGKAEIISDEKIQKIRDTGFNTIQFLLIGKRKNGTIVFDEYNNALMLNDIAKIKKSGIAVWVALDTGGGPPTPDVNLGAYEEFKTAFLNLVQESSKLMEMYQVEYFTVNNEPDMYFNLQKDWGSKEDIENKTAEFMLATTSLARKNFKGKLINKITMVRNHYKNVIDASFTNVDIAGIDVGTSPQLDLEKAIAHFEGEYNLYASESEKRGVQWMNAEYWVGGDSEQDKENQLNYLKISIDAYSKASPKGVGYTYNSLSTFSFPKGKETRLALKEFLSKM